MELVHKPADLGAVATRRCVFDDPDLLPYYASGPDHEDSARLDLNERWSYREERNVRRKTTSHLALDPHPFFGLNIDRGNLAWQSPAISSMT